MSHSFQKMYALATIARRQNKLPVSARVALFVDFLEALDGDVGVDLRGRETGVAQQFLESGSGCGVFIESKGWLMSLPT